MPYIMTAPQYRQYAFVMAPVAVCGTFHELLAEYPRMKAFYGEDLRAAYISKADYNEEEMDYWLNGWDDMEVD